ncbi:hypothetical protein AVEN_52271-1, partial [Araneus ventricosus]
GGPVVAVLLEYDALPNIGHACGHNLIAEAGLAASLGVKAVMEADPKLTGKVSFFTVKKQQLNFLNHTRVRIKNAEKHRGEIDCKSYVSVI